MKFIESIAAKFGYYKLPMKVVKDVSTKLVTENESHHVPSPSDFGLSDNVTFDVVRSGKVGSRSVNWNEMLDFIDACDVNLQTIPGEGVLAAAILGLPINIDGADISFKVRPETC